MYNSVMEMASSRTWEIRPVKRSDRGEIFRLLREATFVHVHADWHLPSDWLGTPAFVISEMAQEGNSQRQVLGCIAAAADPLPAAWMRLVALENISSAQDILAEMLEAILPRLRLQGIDQLAWLPARYWPQQWFGELGFEIGNWIITFVKEDLELPTAPYRDVSIRPVMADDLPRLVELEEKSFDPLWRHSLNGLRLAMNQAISFQVALMNQQQVGFQYSVPGQHPDNVHLVRITVDSKVQSQGIGSALLRAALNDYRRIGATSVSLNTQLDNISSHRLYRRFGFRRIDDDIPLWIMKL